MKHIETLLKIVFFPIVFVLLFIFAAQINEQLVAAFKAAHPKPQPEFVQPEQKSELTIPKLIPSTAI
jgi:hypothetical protein